MTEGSVRNVPATATGSAEFAVDPSPSWPATLYPQQRPPPANGNRAGVKAPDADLLIEVAR